MSNEKKVSAFPGRKPDAPKGEEKYLGGEQGTFDRNPCGSCLSWKRNPGMGLDQGTCMNGPPTPLPITGQGNRIIGQILSRPIIAAATEGCDQWDDGNDPDGEGLEVDDVASGQRVKIQIPADADVGGKIAGVGEEPGEYKVAATSIYPLTFEELRNANVARCLKWHPGGLQSWSPSDWLTAIAGELGELASLIKMMNRERDRLPGNKFPVTVQHVADEMADVLTYLDLMAASMGIDLASAVVAKFNEVSKRVGFTDRLRVEESAAPYLLSPEESMAAFRKQEERRQYRMTVALTCAASLCAAHHRDDAPLSADDLADRAFRVADAMAARAFPET